MRCYICDELLTEEEQIDNDEQVCFECNFWEIIIYEEPLGNE